MKGIYDKNGGKYDMKKYIGCKVDEKWINDKEFWVRGYGTCIWKI